jgi:HSP20 family protein
MFELLRSLQNGHDFGTFGDATADVARPLVGWTPATSAPPADVHETADAIRVLIDLPGYAADSINISFENELLSIEAERKRALDANKTMLVGERSFGKIRRTFGVKVPVDADAIAADYENGILTVTLPKRAEAKPRKIEVKVK